MLKSHISWLIRRVRAIQLIWVVATFSHPAECSRRFANHAVADFILAAGAHFAFLSFWPVYQGDELGEAEARTQDAMIAHVVENAGKELTPEKRNMRATELKQPIVLT
jgi:hypothetical protein